MRRALSAALVVAATACRAGPDVASYPVVSTLDRELAVAVREPPARGADDPRCAARAARDGALYLAPGGRLTFYADLPPESALRAESLAHCGGAARLRLTVETDAAGTSSGEVAVTSEPLAVVLPRAGGPASLQLVVLGEPTAALLVRGLALGARDARSARAPASPAPRPLNVLVYLVDALRRDGLGCYGNPRTVSPNLDQLAADGTRFTDAVAQAAWTRTAVASLFTGLDPASHGVLTSRDALADGAETLAEHLRSSGYRTLALVANGNIGRLLGFDQGFEAMWQRLGGPPHHASAMSAEALGWLDATAKSARPFFAYLHVVEPHAPYRPVEPFRSRFAAGIPAELGSRRSLKGIELAREPPPSATVSQLRALYDAEVAVADAAFGELRAGLEQRGLWETTLVIVLADHGEEFHEHARWKHGSALYEETLAIPLIVRLPGAPVGQVSDGLARQVDVLPTVLEAAGLPVPGGLDGRSLLPFVGGSTLAEPPLLARSYQRFGDYYEAGVTTSAFRFVRTVWDGGDTAERLFDRRADRREQRETSAAWPIATAYFESVLLWPAAKRSPLARPAGRLDRETSEQLRALGYLH